MEQNKINNQNGQVNYPEIKSAPDNPYTEYYNEYIVNPNDTNKAISKGKRVTSIILCAVSNMVMVSFFVMWIAIIFELVTGYRDDEVTVDVSVGLSLSLYAYLMVISLALAIVAKVLNRKSKWALINIISVFVILVVVIVVSLIVPGKAENNRHDRSGIITEALNSDVEDLMGDYSFDVQDFDKKYKYRDGKDYDIWIYISSEASEDQIEELDDFLEDLYDMDSSRKYMITFTVHPVYFEPDDDSSFVFLDTYEFEYSKISPTPEWADIDDHMYVGVYPQRKTSHVPESLEKGQMLIVIR